MRVPGHLIAVLALLAASLVAVSHARGAESAAKPLVRLDEAAGLAAQYSKDGGRLMTCGVSGARVWDVRTWAASTSLMEHTGDGKPVPIARCVFSADAARVVTSSVDEVRVWDGTTGALKHTWRGIGTVRCVALSDDGRRAVTSSAGKPITIWDVESGKPLLVLQHPGEGYFVRFSPGKGDRVYGLVAGPDVAYKHCRQIAVIWDSATGLEVTRKGADDPNFDYLRARRAVFTPDGAIVADPTFPGGRIWEVATGKILGTFEPEGTVYDIAMSPNGDRLATVDGDGCSILDLAGHQIARFKAGPGDHFVAVEFSPDGSHLLAAGSSRYAGVWDIRTQKRLFALPHDSSVPSDQSVTAVAYAPGGKQVAISRASGETTVWAVGADGPQK
jgi:WD40 repeat protein